MVADLKKTSGRVDFIDLLRGWAVIVMIETHVFNATLAADVTSQSFFQYIKFMNGLVAPSFLFASGLAYAVTTRRKLPDYLAFGQPLAKQIGRLLLILGIGYTLHVPIFSLRKLMAGMTVDQLQSFFQVDILQCIAISLLSLQILLLMLRTERRLYRVVLVLGFLIVAVAPFIWSVDFWDLIPWPLAAYMNGLRYSLFPPFPWSAFLFWGAATGYFYAAARERRRPENTIAPEESLMRSLLWAGGCAILVSIAIRPLSLSIYPIHDYWHADPGFFFLRIGIVMLLCGTIFFYQRRPGGAGRSVVILFGRESLLVYVLHLLIIYGSFGKFNFRKEVNQSYGYFEAAVATIILVFLMYIAAHVWSRVKSESPRLKKILNLSTLALTIGLFVFGEGE